MDWTPHTDKDADTASRGVQISNCIVSGYVMGIKGETHTDISILNNIVLNCYLPINCTGVRGVVQRNYTNMLHCEDIKCPQGGLERKRSHLGGMTFAKEENYNLILEISNNYVRTRKYPPITVDRINLKFLYNYVEMGGVANIFKSTGQGRVFGLEIRGNTYYFDKRSKPQESILAHNANARIAGNTFIINTSEPPVLRFLDTQDAQCIDFIDNTVMGPMIIYANIRSNFTANYFSARQPVQTLLSLNAANGSVEKNTFEVPRDFAKAAVTVKGEQWRIKDNIFKITMTSRSKGKARSFIAVRQDSSFIHIADNTLSGNEDDVALLSVEACGVVSVCHNVSDGKAPLVATLSPLKGPITLRGNSFAGGLSRAAPGEEPNRVANLAPQFKPLPGERLYYLLPDAGGKEGIVMTTQGWREFGAISANT
ncbi:hypothetical protein SODG_005407 [Sodalis praecaptivus]|uniref:hypothetical protein n=1 Tax=Sodalis praecaptivus TaxID=1239307 RepID=UPI0027FF8A95|nr:hypothetical protein [Sodalis praecaptivus]CAJ0995796.1 hypothetical protein NVIRENTERO_02081 [Sodalis praecaptivus]